VSKQPQFVQVIGERTVHRRTFWCWGGGKLGPPGISFHVPTAVLCGAELKRGRYTLVRRVPGGKAESICPECQRRCDEYVKRHNERVVGRQGATAPAPEEAR
jgi:hypothetical protein